MQRKSKVALAATTTASALGALLLVPGQLAFSADHLDSPSRTDPASAYVRVDRMGNPAVGSIIGTSLKNPFNDGNLSDDLAGTFLGGTDGFITQLAIIHNVLFDDLTGAGLTPCSTPG